MRNQPGCKMKVYFLFVSAVTITTLIDHLLACEYDVNRNTYFGTEPNCGDQQCVCVGNSARCIGNRKWKTLPRVGQNITDLHAECYDLSYVSRDSFVNIQHLTLNKLRLVHNGIHTISEDVFKEFRHLTSIELSDNDYIDHTSLYSALEGLGKSQIVSIALRGNRIPFLNLSVFETFTALTHLSLSTNKIKSIIGNGSLERLTLLNIQNNYLLPRSFQFCREQRSSNSSRFPSLRALYLGNNYLGSFRKVRTYQWTCLDKLEYLDLTNNTLSKVNISLFTNLTSLKQLNYASNWIQEVIAGNYPPNLEMINFFDNQLTNVPPFLCRGIRKGTTFPKLRVLNFGRNYLQRLQTRWNCLPGIETLDFSTNDVRIISNSTFSNFKNLKNLYLHNLIPWTKVLQPNAFKSNTLINLDIRFNWIDFSKIQNKRLFHVCPNLTRLDLSYNNFSGLTPEHISDILAPLHALEELRIQRIGLKQFPVHILYQFKKLKVLNIDKNQLHSIDFTPSFNNATLHLNIQNVSIADNVITIINSSTFPQSIMDSVKYMDLGDNKFQCDCEMEWFRDQINASGYIGNIQLLNWPDKYTCHSPVSLYGHLFKNFTPDTICKPYNLITICLIAIGSFLIVFCVVGMLCYWNRWYIRYWLYRASSRRRNGRSDDPEQEPILDQMQFDGYVISNTDDDHFVHHSFREMMESRFGYKLHIWKRDSKTGPVVDVIMDAMYASEQILVIISNNLTKDEWCRFQVDVAINRAAEIRRKCVMLVVLEDVDFKPISRSWCVLLTKTPTVYWSNDENSIKQQLFEETVKQHFGVPLRQRQDSIN